MIVQLTRDEFDFEKNDGKSQEGSLYELFDMKDFKLLFLLYIDVADFADHQNKEEPAL